MKKMLLLVLLCLFVLGMTLSVISFLPLNEVKTFINYFDPDNNYRAFSVEFITKIRFAGIFICIASGLIYIVRSNLALYVSSISTLIFYFINNLKTAIKKEDKPHSYAFVVIILLAIAVRIFYLFQPFMGDETRIFETYIYHNSGVSGLIRLLTLRYSGNHFFQTLLSYLTYNLIGGEQWIWTIRLPVLFAGILIVPATYMVVRILFNRNSALLSMGIVAASSPLISYSANARGYTMLSLFFIIILALGAYVKNNNDLSGWYLFAILSAFGAYTIQTMLYPYGIVITWLMLSILFENTGRERIHLLQNLFISIAITILLTFILYSPVILFGTGLESILHPCDQCLAIRSWADFSTRSYSIFWDDWNKGFSIIISCLFIVGVIVSIIFHGKLSVQRVPVALAVPIWLILIFLFSGYLCWYSRCWLFLLPLYIGFAASGIIYLLNSINFVCGKHKDTVLAVFAVAVSVILIWNQIRSRPYQVGDADTFSFPYSHHIDNSGKYIEFMYISVSLKYHMRFDDKRTVKILPLFPSPSYSEFWGTHLKDYFGEWDHKYFISDLDSYLFNDSKKCHSLFIVSSESLPALDGLLEKKGISVADYNNPQLVHQYKYANLYKMQRTRNCSNIYVKNPGG